MMQDPNAAAAIDDLREEIDRLKARVAELEGKTAPNWFGMMGHKPGCPVPTAAGDPKCICAAL